MESITTNRLPEEGFVRLADIVGPGKPIPLSASSWWRGVRSGRFPKPVKLGENSTAWRVGEIRALIDRIERGELSHTQ